MLTSSVDNSKALESKARRLATRLGLALTKSRRAFSPNNHGQFMLFDPQTGIPCLGWDYDATAVDIIEFCEESLREEE